MRKSMGAILAISLAAVAAPVAAHPPGDQPDSRGAHEPRIVAPGEGRAIPVPFHETRLLLSEQASEGGVAVYEFVVPPGTAGAPPHIHSHEDEYAYVLEGELSLLSGDTVSVAGPGTLAALTRGHLHAFWNASDAPVRALFVISGGGQFERFFDAVAVALRDERPAGPDAAGALVGRVAAAHGITIRMDAVPDEARGLFGLR